MISFKKFEEFMNLYKTICKKEKKIDDALRDVSPDFGGFYQNETHYLILEMLKTLMNDEEEDGLIDYYIYELDWGEKWKEGMVTDKDGKDIPLKNTEDLYNLLLEEFNKELYKENDFDEE